MLEVGSFPRSQFVGKRAQSQRAEAGLFLSLPVLNPLFVFPFVALVRVRTPILVYVLLRTLHSQLGHRETTADHLDSARGSIQAGHTNTCGGGEAELNRSTSENIFEDALELV